LLVFIFVGAVALSWYSAYEPNPQIAEVVRITIPEGYNVFQVASALEDAGIFTREEFLNVAEDEEGFLFPDTYEFYRQSSPRVVLQKMKENFEEKTAFLLGPAEEKDIPTRDVIIMASLLEEEASIEKDRKMISGVLWKRLKIGMLLQVDAALTYATGKSSHKLTDADLAGDNPYNTYKYKGLPAGPISNPGLGAIEAALNPIESPYLFYLSDSRGVTYFSKTFDEHKLNKAKYLR